MCLEHKLQITTKHIFYIHYIYRNICSFEVIKLRDGGFTFPNVYVEQIKMKILFRKKQRKIATAFRLSCKVVDFIILI